MFNTGLKKQLFLGSLIVLGFMAAVVIWLQPKIIYTSAEMPSQDAVLKIKEERTEYTEDAILGDLYYNETKLSYSDYNRTLYLSLKDGEIPQLEDFRMILSETDAGLNVLFEDFPEEKELTQAIAEGTGYPIVMYDSDRYMDLKMVFTGMPILDIDFTDEMEGVYTVVNISLQKGINNSGSYLESEAKMRVRGGVSVNYPKLGFKLKLIERDTKGNSVKREESLLGLRRSDSWNLAALYADDTKIRDQVAIDIWEDMSAEKIPFDETFGTRMEYVEVLINDSYMGLYALMEPIDDEQLGISDHGQNGLCEYYYKKLGEEIAQESDFFFGLEETIPEKEDTVPDMILAGLELKNGNGHPTINAWEPVRRFMKMVREESFEKDAQILLDLDNAADVWIYIQAIMGVDNRGKNLYYCAKIVDGEYKIYFLPWDMDLTWGNEMDWSAPLLQTYYTYPVDKILTWSPGTQLIETNVGGIRQIIKERWIQLRQDILSDDAVIERMETEFEYITSKGSYARNKERWEGSPHADDISRLKEYALERLAFLDGYIKEL